MNILAIDCATSILSVALASGDAVFYIESDAGPRHSELLLDAAGELFRQAAIKPRELNLVACMKGPGSFTGLRIGFAAAKGMAASLDIPFVSFPTLDCMAFPHSAWPGTVVPVIDARKKRFFTAFYRDGAPVSDYLELDVQGLAGQLASFEPALITGPDGPALGKLLAELTGTSPPDGALTKKIVFDPSLRTGYAKILLEKAKEYIIFKLSLDTPNSGPVYLRKSDAELSLAINSVKA